MLSRPGRHNVPRLEPQTNTNTMRLTIASSLWRDSCAAALLRAALLTAMGLVCLSPAYAAIAFRASASAALTSAVGNTPILVATSTATAGGGATNALTINTPTGVVSGHVMVAQLTLKGGSAAYGTITAPAGWTLINTTSSSGSDPLTQAVFWKVATASEPASHTWTWTLDVRTAGGIAAFSGVDTLNPIDNWGARSNNDTATITLPNIATNSNNVMLVAPLSSSRAGTHTNATGMAEPYDIASGAGPNGVSASLGTLGSFTNATTGARTASSGSNVDNVAHMISLRAGGAALTINVPTGTTVGDVMIASITMRPCSSTNNGACTTTVTAPTGWTLVRTVQTTNGGGTDGNGNQLWVYQRVVTGAEPVSYTWFFGGRPQQAGAMGGILTFSGVDNSSPIVVESGQNTATGTSHATQAINTGTVTDTMLVSSHASNSSTTWNPPTGMTEHVDLASRTVPDALGISLEINTQLLTAAGAVGAKTATYSSTSAGDTGGTHILALRPAVNLINHVELVHDGAALTCTPKAVTVLGCTGAGTCQGVPAQQFSGNFQISLTAITGATWCSDAACTTTLSSPATVSSGIVIYLREGNVRTDRLAGTTSAATNSTLQCYNTNTSTLNATTACDVAFAASGFLVSLPNHVSCNNSTLTIRAVRSSDNAAQCVPAFTGARSENIRFAYSNPTTGTLAPSVAGTTISTAGTSVSLTFDATGTATPSFNYADVGQLSVTVSNSSLNMTGSTTAVIAPASFAFSGITAGPITAGASFSATVTALNNCATPVATPNFGRETTPESVTLALGSRVAPSGINDCTNGPCSGTVTGNVSGTPIWTNGVATASNLSYSEVGTMTLSATLASGGYLGSLLSASGTSGTVGAFVPARFNTTVTHGCSGGNFTYSGQPFTVAVRALNTAGNTTVNYSNLTGCTVCSKAVTLQDPSDTANFNGTNTVAASAFAAGIGTRNTVAYTFPSVTTAPTTITLRAIDSSVAPNVSSATGTEGTTSVRSGRVRLGNANGSELLTLRLPLSIEYYESLGNGWRPSTGDSCTTLNASDFAFSFAGAGNNLSACETALSLSGSPPSYTATLARPGAGNNGWTDITLNLGATASGNQCTTVGGAGSAATTANRPWLQFDWKGAGAANPGARATFGVRSSGPVIYRTERY